MTSPTVLVATTNRASYPDLVEETAGIIAELGKAGIEARSAIWHDPELDWGEVSAVLVRTTWDYPDFVEDFRCWLDVLDGAEVTVFNPSHFLRWNLDKKYLLELESLGVPVVPITLTSAGGTITAADVPLVVKPRIGVGSSGAHRIGPGESYSPAVPSIVNPFQTRVSEGELSIFIVDGESVHAIRKVPAPEDWRVQPQWGGSYKSEWHPSPDAVAVASMAFETVRDIFRTRDDLCYLRIDLLQSDEGEWRVLEVEGIDPSFYMSVTPTIGSAVASSLKRHLGRSCP